MTPSEHEPSSVEGAQRLGTVISGRYLVQELLGEGGMGTVYLAEHTHMKKRVALKLLHPEMSDNAEVQARFEREAMAAAHIEHPNVAAATDFGRTADGAYFLVLEYVEGTSLRDALAAGALPVARALRIARQIALALERAHEAGIVHRDLKPENVMLVKHEHEPDFVKVLDFGIAKLLEMGAASLATSDVAQRAAQPLTRLGTILGTPEYMAPEQALGEAVTPAADLYGVGVMLYEMLTGKHPFDPPDRAAMLSYHIVAPVPRMQERTPDVEVPATVEAVVRRLLEKESTKRFASARSLIDALDYAATTSGIEGVAAGPVPAPPPSASKWAAQDAFASTTFGTPSPLATPATPDLRSPPVTAPRGVGATRRSLGDALRAQPRRLLLAVAAALPLGFLLVIVVAALAVRTPRGHGDGAALGAGKTETAALARLAPDQRVKGAVALGPEAIEALAREFPEDTSLLGKLAVAYQAQGKTTEALRSVRALVALAPAAANNDDIVQLVTTIAAKGKGDNDDEAFALLEGPLGEHGVDALIDLTAKGPGREIRDLRARAAKSLAKAEVRAHASAAAGVLLDLKGAQLCPAKRDLLVRAKDAGDARILPLLKSLKSTRGCGFLARSDCWGCMRKDAALDDAMAAIEARPPGK